MAQRKDPIKAVVQVMMRSATDLVENIPELVSAVVRSGRLSPGISDYVWKRFFTFISCWCHREVSEGCQIGTVVTDVESCLPLLAEDSAVREPLIRQILTKEMGTSPDPLVNSHKKGSETWYRLNKIEIEILIAKNRGPLLIAIATHVNSISDLESIFRKAKIAGGAFKRVTQNMGEGEKQTPLGRLQREAQALWNLVVAIEEFVRAWISRRRRG